MTSDCQTQVPSAFEACKETLNNLPLISWQGEIEIIESVQEAVAIIPALSTETPLGFDTETRPCFKKGDYHSPALVQFASAHKVWLFRICCMGTLLPLLPLLENREIIKSGVAIHDDVKELQRMEAFTPAGFVDITTLTIPAGIKDRGLRSLCGLLMGGRISKKAQISNWARKELDSKQISYAATDAWISRELYIRACALKNTKAI